MLRLKAENKEEISDNEIYQLLNQSDLIERLTKDYMEHPLFATFRIMGLSEIPYIQTLPYTKKLVEYINNNISTDQGFSCLGGIKEIVPCYNAMLLEAYCRMGFGMTNQAQTALNWIKQYQIFDRGLVTSWPHNGVCKHGGCLGQIPCYIGIGKTIRALITYQDFADNKDPEVEAIINKGIDYMLRHKMFQKLSNGEPICAHITDIMMPQSYALSLTDLVYIMCKRDLITNSNCIPLLDLLKQKEISENQWKIDYIYTYKGYVAFDTRRKPSQWISQLFTKWLYK